MDDLAALALAPLLFSLPPSPAWNQQGEPGQSGPAVVETEPTPTEDAETDAAEPEGRRKYQPGRRLGGGAVLSTLARTGAA